MVKITSTQNAEQYQWGDQCVGWHLLKTDTLNVIQERMPPGSAEERHYHQKAQQLFFILSGQAAFDIDGEIYHLKSGESIHIPPGSVHCVVNNSGEDLEFLLISEPKAHGDRVDW